MQIYSGSSHGFTNPSNAAEARADGQYKVAMERFFKELFGG
jgi:dienelactone hydrolase